MSVSNEVLSKQVVLNEDGDTIDVDALWSAGTVVLVFVRHFG